MSPVVLDERVADQAPGVAPPTPPGGTSHLHLPIGQSITRGALALLSTQPLTWGASLLTATLVPRLLGAQLLGELAIVVTIASVGSTLAALGISEFLVRRFAQQPQALRRDAGIALFVQTGAACLTALSFALALHLPVISFANYPLLLVGLLPVLGAPLQTVLLSSFRGREKHGSYAWTNAISVALSSGGMVLVLIAGGGVVLATAVGGALGIMNSLVAWRLSGVRPIVPRPDRALAREVGEFIRGGLPFLSWQLTLLAYGQIDRLLLGIFVPAFEIGWYAAAYQIIGIVVFVPTLVVAPLFPALSRSAHDPDAVRVSIAQTLRVLLVVMVGLCAASIVVAPGVPRVLGWPADFEHAVPLMMILALHLPVVAVDMVLGVVLMSIHRESRLVMVGLAAAAFNVTANVVGIPYFEHTLGNGAIGAAIITVLTEILMSVGAVWFIPKHLLDARIAWHAARLAIAGAAGVAVGLACFSALSSLTWLVLALAGAALSAEVVFVIAAMLQRALVFDDVRSLTGRIAWRKS